MTAMMAVLGVALILSVLFEAFETMLLPRRVTRSFRLTRMFYLNSWRIWTAMAGLIQPARRRATFLSYFGPLSLLVLLSLWALGLIMGFALLHWSLGTPLHGSGDRLPDLGLYAYFSGVTFFTLGFGDFTPDMIGGICGIRKNQHEHLARRDSSCDSLCPVRPEFDIPRGDPASNAIGF